MDKQIDERTCYSVFGSSSKSFNGGLTVSFQFSPLLVDCSGNILRITDPSDRSFIWNVSFDGTAMPPDEIAIRVNEEGHSSVIYSGVPKSEMAELTWTQITLDFDFLRDLIVLNIGERQWAAYYDFGQTRRRLSIQFGKSGHMTDVAPFSIKDLTISDRNRAFVFPLDETHGKIVRDSKRKIRGTVSNPLWLLKESLEWSPLSEIHSNTCGGAIYVPNRKSVLLYDMEGVWAYDLVTKATSFRRYGNKCPLEFEQGTCYLSGNYLIAYETRKETSFLGPKAARLNLDTYIWEESWEAPLASSRFHHASFVNPENGRYTIFGGYGFKVYSNEFLEFNEQSGQWEETWQDLKGSIIPRYFTSAGVDPENKYVYIFGGMGNECGEAVVGRGYHYDLHRIDVANGTSEKLWEIDLPKSEMVPARNLVVTDEYIYAACYPEYNTNSEILLYRFSIEDGSMDVYGTPVPINSDKIGTNANLYYDHDINKLFLLTKASPDQRSTDLNVYSLNFPPLARKAVDENKWIEVLVVSISIAFLICVIVAAIYFVRRAAKRKTLSRKYHLSKANPGKKVFRTANRPNSINVFGIFQIIDRDGNDITSTFFAQSSLLLVLLIKYGDRGLSARRMSAIFWPDKSEEKARNSRGVAINTLRKKLQNLDGVSIVFRDKRYYLEIEEPAHCDCYSVKAWLADPSSHCSELLCTLSKGKFLANMTDPSLDEFKEEMDDAGVAFLEKEIAARYASYQWLDVIEIGEMLLMYDSTSEIAIVHEVHALRNIGQEDDAKEKFSVFASEVRRMTGEACPFDYKTLPLPSSKD